MNEFDRINKERTKEALKKFSPNTDLQLNYMVTAPAWGDPTEISGELQNHLQKSSYELIKAGEIRQIQKNDGTVEDFKFKENTLVKKNRDVWLDLQAIFTRDLRLGNLNGQEVDFCSYMFNLAGDLLDENFNDAFAKSLRLGITPLEISQSRKFAFRKLMNTLYQEQKLTEEQAPKRNLLGSRNKKE